MEAKPTWQVLRTRKYSKVGQHSKNGISHAREWESTKLHRTHSLRISEDFHAFLMSQKKGPQGRRSSRVGGATPDESFIQPGQRPNGLPHKLRSKMNLLFNCEAEFIQHLLESDLEYKPQKKIRVNLVMPNLENGIDDIFREMIRRNPSLRPHPAFNKRWAPAICRLIELKWHHERPSKKKS